MLITFTTLFAQTNERVELAKEQYSKKQFAKAIKTIDTVLENDLLNEEAYAIKGLCLIRLKKYQEAYIVFSKGIEEIKTTELLYSSRAALFQGSKEFEFAIKDYNKAIEYADSDTTKYTIMSRRGGAKWKIMDFEGAYSDYIQAYEFDTTDVATINNLAMVCNDLGQSDKSLEYLYKVIEIEPTLVAGYVNLGYAHKTIGKYEKAIEFYNKAISLEEKSPLAYSNRAHSYYYLGKQKQALKDIDYSLKLHPSNSYAYWVRSLIHIKDNNIDKACLDLDMALYHGYDTMYGDEVEKLIFEHCE